jgi:hypothetical protein
LLASIDHNRIGVQLCGRRWEIDVVMPISFTCCVP